VSEVLLFSPVFVSASSIKEGVFAGPFFKEREFDLISHAGVSLFT